VLSRLLVITKKIPSRRRMICAVLDSTFIRFLSMTLTPKECHHSKWYRLWEPTSAGCIKPGQGLEILAGLLKQSPPFWGYVENDMPTEFKAMLTEFVHLHFPWAMKENPDTTVCARMKKQYMTDSTTWNGWVQYSIQMA
jgi:hypothetical protein